MIKRTTEETNTTTEEVVADVPQGNRYFFPEKNVTVVAESLEEAEKIIEGEQSNG